MERIENILRRIQELYQSKQEKTGIDIDLMLDYTRVMYADLLEWRKRFKDMPEVPVVAERDEEQPVVAAAAEEEKQTVAEPAEAVATVPDTTKQETLKAEEAQPVEERARAVTDNDTNEQEARQENRVAGQQKEQEEAGVVKEVLHNNSSAISFEPPAPGCRILQRLKMY